MPLATTRWSLILAAGDPEAPQRRQALEELCSTYWYPLYAYARRKGASEHDASESTQGFFSELLERNLVAKADPSRGRFRAFLLTSFKNFLANERRAERAEKRGGKVVRFSIDSHVGEQRYLREPVDTLTPERIFERRWALTVLEQSLERLREDYQGRGKGELFERLEPCLLGDKVDRYAVLAEEFDMSVSNVKITVHRLRQRFRSQLRLAIAHTADPQNVGEELRHLAAVVNESC